MFLIKQIDNKFQFVDFFLDKSIPIFEQIKKSMDSGYQDLDSINLDLDLSRLSRPPCLISTNNIMQN
jgi:hypothetical protein